MDLNTVVEIRDARQPAPWLPGDAWLGGGTYLFSEPQPHLRRLVDLSRTGWTPVRILGEDAAGRPVDALDGESVNGTADEPGDAQNDRPADPSAPRPSAPRPAAPRPAAGSLEIAATCTIAQLSRFGATFRAPAAPLFEQCCRAFLASFKIWNMATVGGNLCSALPAGPMISLTAALDGTCLLRSQSGALREVPVADFVVGDGRTVLTEGELLRSVTLPARALNRRTAFRQASLYGLGRSGVLVIGTLDPVDHSVTVTLTASTVRPVRLRFPLPPTAAELSAALTSAVADDEWFDDIHGLPEWRRHMTLRLAEEIRAELSGEPGGGPGADPGGVPGAGPGGGPGADPGGEPGAGPSGEPIREPGAHPDAGSTPEPHAERGTEPRGNGAR